MRQNSNWVQSALESSKQILISASCKYLLSGFARRWRSSFSLSRCSDRRVTCGGVRCSMIDDRWFFRSPSRGTMQQSMAGFLSFVGTNLTFTVVAVFQLHRPYLSMYVSRSTEELQPERQNKKLLPTKGILVVELAIFSIFRSFWDALQTLWREFLHKSGTEKVVRMVSTVNENNVWRVDFLIFRSNLPLLVGSR